MKKDIEWLQDEISHLATTSAEFINDGLNYIDSAIPVANVYDLIDQLDKPEVLSQEWIINNQERKGVHFFVNVTKLQDLVVPTQELPVIPKYVDEYISLSKNNISLKQVLEKSIRRDEWTTWIKAYSWISANDEIFARAWLDGYKVAEEQKYYVDLDTAAYVAKWKDDDRVGIYTDGISGSDGFEFHLTEQEIKNYDERFWPFAKPVE